MLHSEGEFSREADVAKLEEFVFQQNITRFQKLLTETADPAEKIRLANLLNTERADFSRYRNDADSGPQPSPSA